jgi:UDP-N-acetylmuramate: L-alanyl-gamma-D-glutamyl-meso-diaminopimelate ligase
MNIHFIAIGGSAMHNLAIALHKKGYKVTGSDDEVFEPSKTRLKKYGLLPDKEGWDTNNIHKNIDAVILGMHARIDNPELIKAQELGLKVYSYPEYIYEQTKNKKRIVIGGSHGKTSITAMLLHVLSHLGIKSDFLVGAQLEGFETMVSLESDSEYAVIEGDEYLSSPIDRRPKFHLYQPDIALVSGIAWDHINVFKTFDIYKEQFSIFIDKIDKNGFLTYCAEDKILEEVVKTSHQPKMVKPYQTPNFEIINGITFILDNGNRYELNVFGKHNLMNIEGAKNICEYIGISNHDFYSAISSFKGASGRMQLIDKSEKSLFFRDFAHSPSKLAATVKAAKEQFNSKKLIACMELHTFSSLNKEFLEQYAGCMDLADVAVVYFNPHTLQHKKLPEISIEEVKKAFANENIVVLNESQKVIEKLRQENTEEAVFLMMSSGNFDGINYYTLASELFNK